VISDETDAVVVRKRPFSETSLVVDFYTRNYGRVVALARGARRREATVKGAIEFLSAGSAVFYFKRGGSVTLKSYEPADYLPVLRTHWRRMWAAQAIAEHLALGTAERVAEPDLYGLARVGLDACAVGVDGPSVACAYLMRALATAGVLPAVDVCGGCGAPLVGLARYSPARQVFLCAQCVGGRKVITLPEGASAAVAGMLRLAPSRFGRLRLDRRHVAALLRWASAVSELAFQTRLRVAEWLAARIDGTWD